MRILINQLSNVVIHKLRWVIHGIVYKGFRGMCKVVASYNFHVNDRKIPHNRLLFSYELCPSL